MNKFHILNYYSVIVYFPNKSHSVEHLGEKRSGGGGVGGRNWGEVSGG